MPAKIFSHELIRMSGKSLDEFAASVGTYKPKLINYIYGHNVPDLPRARKIAEALGLPLDDLVFPGESKVKEYGWLKKEAKKRTKKLSDGQASQTNFRLI